MATFGQTTAGTADYDAEQSGVITVRKAPLVEAGSLESLSIYGRGTNGAGTQKYRLVLFTDNAGSPGNFVAASAEQTADTDSTIEWKTAGLTASLAAGDYWLGIWYGTRSSTGYMRWHCQATTGGDVAYKLEAYHATNDPTSAFGTPGFTGTNDMCVYGTYTPTASGLLIPVAMCHYQQQ